jgi:hypothetical protein
MSASSVNDPEFWQGRANEARAVAARMSDELSRTAMLALAARYDRIANRVVRGVNIFGSTGSAQLPIRGFTSLRAIVASPQHELRYTHKPVKAAPLLLRTK